MLSMLIGTIDFYGHIPLSLTSTLPWGHKVGAKQNLLASFSGTFFFFFFLNLIRLKFGVVMKQFKLNILRLISSKIFSFFLNKGNNCCLTDCIKNNNKNGMHLDVLIQAWCDDTCYCSLHCGTSPVDRDLDSRSQECRRTKLYYQLSHKVVYQFKTLLPIISQSCVSI